RCASQAAHSTSVRRIHSELSASSRTLSFSTGCVNDGQPVPDSNLASEENSGVPQHTQRYMPSRWLSQYSPENARSVPFLRVTWNCSLVNCDFHSASVL